ncbi:MAG: hypothetical protein IT330_15580 [Anaerolineae bacterium]|nr:hypothetical protein [Anaerolineae bacterium]
MSDQIAQDIPVRWEVKAQFQAAMAIFVITVVIGILNGLKVMEFSRADLLTHVHAGTVGWITLGVLATSIWLFGGSRSTASNGRLLPATSVLAVVAVPLYVLAFWSGNFTLRAIFGVPVLVAIAGLFIWIISQSRHTRLGVAHLAILGAIVNLSVGSVIGVLMQFQFALARALLPAEAFTAHPSTLVIGYLILVGMAITEWRFAPDTGRLSRLGLVQIALPFLGGVALTLGSLLNIQALIFLNVPLEILGVLIYIGRFASRLSHIRWMEQTADRHFGLSGVFLVLNVALLSYLIISYVSGAYGSPPRFELIPPWLIIGMDHAMFLGVMSNTLFGLIQLLAWDRRAFWPWADHVLFWGMNFGFVGFVVSLLTHSPQFEKVFTPIMGVSILLAILTYTIRLQTLATSPIPARATPPAA